MKELPDPPPDNSIGRGTMHYFGLPSAPVRVLIDYRPALRHRTGVGEYIHRLTHALAESDGLSVSVFSSSWKDRLAPAVVGDRVGAIDRRVPVRLLNLLWHRLEWPTIEWLTGQRFDIAHSAHPLLMPSRTAAQVVTIHDLDFLDHPERTRAEIRRDYPALAKAHAARADMIVAVSHYAARRAAERLELDLAKLAVCPAGAPDWTARTQPALAGHILFVGTLEPRKNVGTLLDAYERLIETHPEVPPMMLAGAVTPDAAAWLARLARPPLAGRVQHVGYVDAREQRRLYDQAAVLVLPSLDEGFGLPVLEAMAAGVPVVASNRGSLPEIVGNAGLLVDAERSDDLADALARVVFNRATAEALIERGQVRVRQFTWRAAAAAVVAAYASAIERRQQRQGHANRN